MFILWGGEHFLSGPILTLGFAIWLLLPLGQVMVSFEPSRNLIYLLHLYFGFGFVGIRAWVLQSESNTLNRLHNVGWADVQLSMIALWPPRSAGSDVRSNPMFCQSLMRLPASEAAGMA